MRLYAGTSEQFITDTVQNQIADKLKIAFFASFLLPVVICIAAFMLMNAGASEYTNPTRAEISLAAFLYTVIIGIVVTIICIPVWIMLGIKAFRKQAENKVEDAGEGQD